MQLTFSNGNSYGKLLNAIQRHFSKWSAVETTYRRHNTRIFSTLLHQLNHPAHASINAQDEIAFSTPSLTL